MSSTGQESVPKENILWVKVTEEMEMCRTETVRQFSPSSAVQQLLSPPLRAEWSKKTSQETPEVQRFVDHTASELVIECRQNL